MHSAYSQPQTIPARSSTRTGARKTTRTQSEPASRPTTFSLSMPDAITVYIAGTFNDWDATRTAMRKDQAGIWKATLTLPPGRYEYRFVVDGDWISDPNATELVENPFGQTNSVLAV